MLNMMAGCAGNAAWVCWLALRAMLAGYASMQTGYAG